MYSPSYTRLEDRAELLEFMRANSFAVVVTGTGGTLHASHLPVMVHDHGKDLVIDDHGPDRSSCGIHGDELVRKGRMISARTPCGTLSRSRRRASSP